MNKETIQNTYAIEQGYESWERLVYWYITSSDDRLIYHLNAVTDLIQEELKKKIVNETQGMFFTDSDREITFKEILNTEIL